MSSSKQIYNLLDVLRGDLQPKDYIDLFAIGSLFMYLGGHPKYSTIVNMKKLLRAGAGARNELLTDLQNVENEIPYFKNVFSEFKSLDYIESSQITRFFYELNTLDHDDLEISVYFDDVIKSILEKGGKGEGGHVTPSSINQLVTAILQPIQGTFYDGACGIAGGLGEAKHYAEELGGTLKLFGQEIDSKIWAVSKIKLFISGKEDAQIIKGDVLNQPGFLDTNELKKFDYVYMDAPFSLTIKNLDFLENDSYNRFFYGMPPRNNGDFSFISHALASLNEDGKAISVATAGALFRGGAEGRIRRNIILSDMIEAVISLPAGLYDNTSIPVNLILFNKNKDESRRNKILLVKAEEYFSEKRWSRRFLSKENIKKIADVVKNGKEISEFSIFVNDSELVDDNLLPSRYLFPSEVEIEGYGKVKFNKKALTDVNTVVLEDVASFFRGYNVGAQNEESADGEFRIVKLSDVQNGKLNMDSISRYDIDNNAKIEMYSLQEGDVILSIRGNWPKVAVVNDDDNNLLLSQNFLGIRCGKNLNPDFLKVYLESPLGQYLLTNKMSGTTISTLSRRDVETLEIPLIPIKEQEVLMNSYTKNEQVLEQKVQEIKLQLYKMKLQTYNEMGIKSVFEIKR